MDVVLIPAYEPDEQLIGLTRHLKAEGFFVLVVDDGSGEAYKQVFAAAAENATVVTLAKNRGKGGALKTGMAYIRDELPDCRYFITCDADGQHRVEDVIRVRELLHSGQKFVLTVRRPRRGIPLRSKVGNVLSRYVYTLLTSRYLSDNQSGLRGFARDHLDWLLQVEKNNYDYEMNMLYYAAKKNIYVATLPIEAIYIDDNRSSHFNPIADTVRIYRSLFTLARGSLWGFAAAELTVLLGALLWGYRHITFTVPTAGALGYVVCALLNKYRIFRSTHCHDYLTMLIYTIIEYFVYTLGCILCGLLLPGLSLFFGFNLVYLLCIPLRYLLHKSIFIASRTHE